MAQFSGTGIVNVDWLNMRASPGGKILSTLKGGSEVTVSGRSMGWLDIWFNGVRGSVFSKYITLHPQVQAPPIAIQEEEREPQLQPTTASEFIRQGEVTASLLNLRSGPNGHVLGKLDQGSVVTIISEANGWMQVADRDRKGFVSSRYVRPSQSKKVASSKTAEPSPSKQGFRIDGDWAISPDGKRFAKKFRKGVFSSGNTTINDFIDTNQATIKSMTPSQLRLMAAVSENEGKLEAINTWDNAFLSFGIFQWTAGVRSDAGELPALLDRLQRRFPEVYEKHFGLYGLELSGVRQTPGSPARGYFKLNDQLLASADQKIVLRMLVWPYRFKQAGTDDQVRLVQLEHAVKRINCFLKIDNRKIREHYIGDYITSEYGIAQLLDQHVNRPAHVLSTLRKAVESQENEMDIDNPKNWGDDDERKLMEVYLAFRKSTSMTDGPQRAERIRRQLQNGVISDKRGSYQA